jgi:hypothetical protein
MIQIYYGKAPIIFLAISTLLFPVHTQILAQGASPQRQPAPGKPVHLLSVEAPSVVSTQFIPITPCRIVDTRNANGPLGGAILAPQTSRDFPIPSGTCGIPVNSSAYSLNATVYPPGPLGSLTLWTPGRPQHPVWTLTSLDGRV